MEPYTQASYTGYGPTMMTWFLVLVFGGLFALFLIAATLRACTVIRRWDQNRLNIEYNKGVTDTGVLLEKTANEYYWRGREDASIKYYGSGFEHGNSYGHRNGFNQGHYMGEIDQSIFLLEKYANRD